jgi:hypothetical protein
MFVNDAVIYSEENNVLKLRLMGGESSSLIASLTKVWRIASLMSMTFNLLVDARSLTKLDAYGMSLLAFFETVKSTSVKCVITTHIIVDEHCDRLYDKMLAVYSPVRPIILHYTYGTVPTNFTNKRL